MSSVTYSLIVCNYQRTVELERFLKSLQDQTLRDFEVILIDQNPNDSLSPLLQKFQQNGLSIRTQKSSRRLLSACRNMGLKMAQGQFIAFPDDDCWYPSTTLQQVSRYFSNPAIDIVGGKSLDPANNIEMISSFPKSSVPFKFSNAYSIGISVSFFFRKKIFEKLHFDENLGAGTPLGSGEETDFILRCLENGYQGQYFPELVVWHPAPSKALDQNILNKNYQYALGFGYVMRKHYRLDLFPHLLRSMIIRPLGGMLLGIAKPLEFKNRWLIFKGRWQGFFGWY